VDVPGREVKYNRIYIYIYIYIFHVTHGIKRGQVLNVCVCTRSLGGFKSNVRNKAAPEGCIAEGYIATELVTFCSRYLENAPTFHNRPLRNPDGSKGAGTRVRLNRLTMHQIHRYIVFNSDEFLNLRM
jgi:hypothetical protein